MIRSRLALLPLLGLLLTLAACERACGPKTEAPAPAVPIVKGPDGQEYVLLAKGGYKPIFDAQGKLERVDYDRNGDGRVDQVARHDGNRLPQVLEDDDDFDGTVDRWAYYNAAGALTKIGTSRKAGGRPDFWIHYGPDGKPTRQEYDSDGDGQPDRAEVLKDGRLELVEVDSDRDGRIDRWQKWTDGALVFENLDTDGDGKPDKRLRYGPKGEVVGIEPITGQ